MRTTPTLDDDVAPKLKGARQPFKIKPRDLGGVRPGLSLDNVADLIEHVEGPLHP
jgi:hypothetical protein